MKRYSQTGLSFDQYPPGVNPILKHASFLQCERLSTLMILMKIYIQIYFWSVRTPKPQILIPKPCRLCSSYRCQGRLGLDSCWQFFLQSTWMGEERRPRIHGEWDFGFRLRIRELGSKLLKGVLYRGLLWGLLRGILRV